MTQRRPQLLLLATVLIWGATFTLVKAALASCTPLLFNFLRMALATATLLVVNRHQLKHLTKSQIRVGSAAGLFLAIGYQFQTLGLAHTSPAHSAFITGLTVIFVPALTLVPRLRFAGTARPGLPAALGAALAFAGLYLLTVPPAATLASINPGDLLSLLCAVSFAAHCLSLGYAAPRMPAGVLATVQIAVTTVIMAVTLPLQPEHVTFTPALTLALAVCALLATAAAFTIQSYAQQVLPPTQTILIIALEPVFATLTSLLLLHESLTPRGLLGATLILLAILAIELLPTRHPTEIPA